MRKAKSILLLVITLLLVSAAPSHAWSRGFHRHPGVRTLVFIGVGPAFWWGPPYPYWGYYPPPYYVYSPPPVVVEEPPVYIQQQPATPPAPETYWYYCQSARAYYPSVQSCPEPWIKLPPKAQ